jgi:hypothetical protein
MHAMGQLQSEFWLHSTQTPCEPTPEQQSLQSVPPQGSFGSLHGPATQKPSVWTPLQQSEQSAVMQAVGVPPSCVQGLHVLSLAQ